MPARNERAVDVQPFVISRTFAAPRDVMWKAWTEPERMAQWFGPKGLKGIHSKNDLRPGGMYHYALQGPDGSVMWGRWIYREIAPPEKLVSVNSFSDEHGGLTRHPAMTEWPLELLTTVTFEETADGTKVTVNWIPLNASDAELDVFEAGRKSMEGGWTGTFAQLDEYLTSDREIAAVRTFDAPRQMVWNAWTNAEHIGNWWGPRGFTTTTTHMDVRPGGQWLFVMHGPDGTDYRNEITYVEVEEPRRLVYDHGPSPRFRVTVAFEEREGRTEISMRMLFESAEIRQKVEETFGAVEGLHQTLDRLREHLAGGAR